MGIVLQDLTAITILNDTPALGKTSRQGETPAVQSIDSLDLLWKEFFKDPSQWLDNRSTKANPRSPDFKHKGGEESLWMFNWFNPCWVQEELRRRGLKAIHPSSSVLQDGASLFTEEKELVLKETPQFHSCTLDDQVLGKPTARRLLQIEQEEDDQQEHDKILPKMELTVHVVPNINCSSQKGSLLQQNEESIAIADSSHQNSEEDARLSINYVRWLKACADQLDILHGGALHADIVRRGLLKSNLILGSSVVNFYAKCGALAKAQEVLNELPVRNVVAWNALISGYAQHERGQDALDCFARMQQEGVPADAVTLVCTLNACGSVGSLEKGQEVHTYIIKEGFLDINVVVANALIDMYASCHNLDKAQNVFSDLKIQDVVTWTTLITGFVRHGQGKEALHCFEMMQLRGFVPNLATRLGILKACGVEGELHKGQRMHAELIRNGSLQNSMVVGTALVDMYAKCGVLVEAEKLFEELPMQDVVSWGALLEGYAQHSDGDEALDCFERMQDEGVAPDAVTFICALKASGSVGAARKGLEIHDYITREGSLRRDVVVANSLVDVYVKCGMLAEAQAVFDELRVRDLVSWNALIAGYAHLGEEEVVDSLYNRMTREGTEPDCVTFTIVLNACAHRGLLSKGQSYFESMIRVYGMVPTLEHHTCMVDLFGRAGHVDKAVALIKAMPIRADTSTWHTVLGACQSLGNMKLGTWAFERASSLDRKRCAAYVCLSNAYASFGKQRNLEEIEAFSGEQQPLHTLEDCRWIDATGLVHHFCVGDTKKHVQIELIYAKLEYIPHRQLIEGDHSGLHQGVRKLEDADDDVLCGHGEKLAVTCALINTPDEAPLIVFKNACVCHACHSEIALISRIENRKIFVRDANRLHSFQYGYCGCGTF